MLELLKAKTHPPGETIVLIAGYLQEPPGYGNHLDRVERGNCPLKCVRFSNRVARHQTLGFPSQVKQTSTAFEYLKSSVTQERNLSERLVREMIGLATIERDRSHRVWELSFLARPSEPQVAHEPARAFSHPVVGPDGQFAHRSNPRRGTGLPRHTLRFQMVDMPPNGSALSCERADREGTSPSRAARRKEPLASEASQCSDASKRDWRSSAAAPC